MMDGINKPESGIVTMGWNHLYRSSVSLPRPTLLRKASGFVLGKVKDGLSDVGSKFENAWLLSLSHGARETQREVTPSNRKLLFVDANKPRRIFSIMSTNRDASPLVWAKQPNCRSSRIGTNRRAGSIIVSLRGGGRVRKEGGSPTSTTAVRTSWYCVVWGWR